MNLSKLSEYKELFSLAYASENNDEILLSLEFFLYYLLIISFSSSCILCR